MTVIATYVSSKAGLRVRRSNTRRDDFFQFKDGRLEFHDQAELDLFESILKGMAPSSRALMRKVSIEDAAKIAKKHQSKLLEIKNKVIQGAQTASARSEQIHEVTTLLKGTEAEHSNIKLAQQLGGQGQLGIVDEARGDKPNPSAEVVAASIAATPQKAEAQIVNTPASKIMAPKK